MNTLTNNPIYVGIISYYDLSRLWLASRFADFRKRTEKAEFYVLPNQDERLLVLSLAEIEELKKIGEIQYKKMGQLKVFTRRKKKGGVLRNVLVRRYRIIGEKAYGVTLMDTKVELQDIERESFYLTAALTNGETTTPPDVRKIMWVRYMQRVRAKKRLAKKNQELKKKKA